MTVAAWCTEPALLTVGRLPHAVRPIMAAASAAVTGIRAVRFMLVMLPDPSPRDISADTETPPWLQASHPACPGLSPLSGSPHESGLARCHRRCGPRGGRRDFAAGGVARRGGARGGGGPARRAARGRAR